jgi:hypothetical protein
MEGSTDIRGGLGGFGGVLGVVSKLPARGRATCRGRERCHVWSVLWSVQEAPGRPMQTTLESSLGIREIGYIFCQLEVFRLRDLLGVGVI